MATKTKACTAKERQVLQKEKELSRKSEEISRKEAQVSHKELDISEKERQAFEKQQAVSKREAKVSDAETKAVLEGRRLSGLNEELKRKKQEADERETRSASQVARCTACIHTAEVRNNLDQNVPQNVPSTTNHTFIWYGLTCATFRGGMGYMYF